MELVLKLNSKQKPVKMVALAKKLNTLSEKRDTDILNFKAAVSSAFGDAAEWEKAQRVDRELPF